MNIEQGKYYLQRQEHNPYFGEILEMFHFRGEDEEGMTDAQVCYFIYDNGLSWDDAYYSNYNFEKSCIEIPKFFWDGWLHTLFIIKNHVVSFLKPNGVSEENVNNGIIMHTATDIGNEDSPYFFIDENTYCYGDSVREKCDNFDDFDEIAVCVDREAVDITIYMAKKLLNIVKGQMKKVFFASMGKYIPCVTIDLNHDDDENHKYKFLIPQNAHTIRKGEKVIVSPCVDLEKKISGTVIDCHDDGLVIHTDKRIDITDDYAIEEIKIPSHIRIEDESVKKVLFLDFDGVMVTDRYQAQLMASDSPLRDGHGAKFDPICVENLRQIIDSTDAEIAVTSTWKTNLGLDGIQQMWQARNLPGKVVGVTPNIDTLHRGNEIQAWLDANPNAVRYAIIDDCPILDFFREEQLQHLFKVDERTGLDEETANKIIEHLRYT